MRSVILLVIFFALSLARTGWADGDRVILIVGDSLSAAYGIELDESWPRLLQRRLSENGHAYRVFNSSIVGDTTESGIARLPQLLSEQRPAIVIIELGGNDGLRGLPVDVTRKNLLSMIDLSQATGAKIVLVGIRLPPNYGMRYTKDFSDMFASIAGNGDVIFIPFLLEGIALDPALMQDDGIHPTAQAQPLVLENVWQALQPILR